MNLKLTSFLVVSSFAGLFASTLHASSLVNGFDVVTLEGFSSQYSDLQGTLAVGGNLTLQGYSLNQSAPASNSTAGGYDTVVGGNFSLSYGTIYGPVHSASASINFSTVCTGCSVTGANSPLNFGSLASSVRAENSYLYQLTPNGSVTMPYSTLNLTASGNSTTQVFSISSSQLSNNSGINITNLASNEVVIINVTDSGSHTATTSIAGLQINGTQVQSAGNVLFNFASSITNITIANSFYASLLAPDAAVSGTYGAFNGDMVSLSYSGSNQFNLDPFTGTLPASTPEPGSIGLIAGGALVVAFFNRKRARKS